MTKTAKASLPPHIFAIAGSAYQGLLRELKNQVRFTMKYIVVL